MPAHLHASPRRGDAPYSDKATGEVRIPLSLFRFDECQGDADLVLSRLEGERLLEDLWAALTVSAESTTLSRPEPVR